MRSIDFGRHTNDYSTHRPGFPPTFYHRLDSIIQLDTAHSLDLGTGPGIIALELAHRGSTVLGIDISDHQIATARRVARDLTLDHRAQFHVARAEHTGLDPDTFDLVTAGTCWHWFDQTAALTEIRRVLRPRGILAIASYSYLVAHSPAARDSETLVLQFNPTWNMAGFSGLHPEQIDQTRDGGFDLVEAFCFDHDEVFSHERWRGRMRTCNGVGSGELSPADVLRFDAALAELLRDRHPDPLIIPHRVWCVVARKPA